MSCKKLEGKVAIVTGGARGIGKSISEKLAAEGASLVLVDVLLEVAEQTANEFMVKGVKALAVKADVSKLAEAEVAVAKAVEHFGQVDILINNAGITKDTLLLRMTAEDWQKVIDINLTGAFNFIKAVIRPMMKKGGKIVNISSVVGRMGNAGQANYSASKAGLIGLTKTVAKEFASRNINCNAIAPGFIATEMTHKLPQAAIDTFLSVTPMKRPGTPEDVAKAVCFFCTADSDYITGQVLNVDGGMLM